MKKYYDILKLPVDATPSAIKKAYYKLAKKYHPDVCSEEGARQKFIEINEAYEILTNPQLQKKLKRNSYQKQQTNPTWQQKKRANNNARRNANMKAEEFKRYKMKAFKKDKERLLKMIIALLCLPVIIAFIIWFNNDPTKNGYNPNLHIAAYTVLMIPVSIISIILSLIFFRMTSDQKQFNKIWK